MTRKSPRQFTSEFKEEAIKLVTEHGYTQKDATESLGVNSRNILIVGFRKKLNLKKSQ
ncbi:MAG TPA: transposase [Candidatus Babeliales bacterium]|nr:transposase [Candidatus Babeliales bacterium]